MNEPRRRKRILSTILLFAPLSQSVQAEASRENVPEKHSRQRTIEDRRIKYSIPGSTRRKVGSNAHQPDLDDPGQRCGLTVAPSHAQTYDPNFPVCLQVYAPRGGYIDCSYTSLAQCQATASGRGAHATPTRTSRMGISLGDLFTGTGEIIRRLVHYQIGRCSNLKGRHQIPQPMEYGCGRRRLGVISHGQPCWLKQFQPFSR